MKKYFKATEGLFWASNLLAILNVLCVSYYPLLLSYVIDHFDSLNRRSLLAIFVSFALSVVLILITSYLNKITKANYRKKICHLIRRDVFRGIARMDYAQFHSQKSEKYTSFLVNDIEQLYTKYFENFIYLANSILMLAAYTVILAFVSWQECLTIMGSLLLIFFIPQLVGGKYHALNGSVSSSKADYLSRCEEILSAHDLMNECSQDRLCAIHDEQLLHMQQQDYRLEKYRSFVQIFSGSTLYLQLILCFAAGLLFTYYGIISMGVFASSLLYVEYVASYSSTIVDEFLEIRSMKTYRDKCMEYIHSNPRKKETRKAPFESLQLDSVSYCVEGKSILRNICCEFHRGGKYLIVGDNGSGKSTLLRLIAGITEPSDGQVLFNGTSEYLHDDVSYIPQRRYLFEGTILDNITLFASDLHEQEKAKIASMCELVKLKYPLSHPVSRNADNLSGGEAAKICLVRELYQGRDLLLIDEPMNDIDESSERDILDFLLKLKQTVIVVSHGLSKTNGFDEVIIVQDGEISCSK